MIIRHQKEFNYYIRLELAGSLYCPDAWHGEEHKHAFWELLYVQHGRCDVMVEEKLWKVEEGQAILIRPLENHLFAAEYGDTTMVYVGFRCESGQNLWTESFDHEIHLLDVLPENETLRNTLNEIANDEKKLGDEIQIIQSLVPLVRWMKDKTENDGDLANSQKNILCQKTIKYIRSNMNRFVTVEEIAASLYVTPHYLGLVFSSCMKTTILKYQQAIKLERATVLIRAGSVTLSEISYSLGFSSQQYFSKCFHGYYGFSPNQLKMNS